MQLSKFKVNKFRSVKGTEWIGTDQLTCFVGVNESGKTNLLLPLWKFNPADDSTKIDLLLDYPRDEYSKINENDGRRKSQSFVEVLFKLDQEEINDFEKAYQEHLKSEDKNDNDESTIETNDEPKESKIQFSEFLLIGKNYNEHFYIYISNESGEKLTSDIEDSVGEECFEKICNKIPKFVYYSEYGNLDSDLYLPRVKEDLARIDSLSGKERMKARTLKILFGHLNLDPNEILQ